MWSQNALGQGRENRFCGDLDPELRSKRTLSRKDDRTVNK